MRRYALYSEDMCYCDIRKIFHLSLFDNDVRIVEYFFRNKELR